ncbi:MAG: thioesterase family protein [Myxococcota bacterium]|jgi:acyl-CoA thioesterase|nr:thioesterase family protein [Myxococcota bacterium]MEC9443166.1 thioesterase family protein [Myxococcota bacterium]
MSDAAFESLSTPIRQDRTTFVWQVPQGWQQGRGVFGGLVLAALVRAMEEAVAGETPLPLRTITATLCGATVPGEATIEIEFLRLGSNTTTIAAKLIQEGELRTHIVGLFGKDRGVGELGDWKTLQAPELPWHEEIPIAPMKPPLAPMFTQFMNFQPTSHFPFTGGDELKSLGWVRVKNPGEDRGAPYIAAHADAWWPTMLATLDSFRPLATVTFTLELFEDFDMENLDAPMIHRAEAVASRGGYFAEFRELWGADGRLLALNQQTFCVIK